MDAIDLWKEPTTFQCCMMSIFLDLEDIIEVFMGEFSMVCDSFDDCFAHLSCVRKRCEVRNLVPNWEK